MNVQIFLLLYLGTWISSVSEGNSFSRSKVRDRRFLFENIFGGKPPSLSYNEIQMLPESSLTEAESFRQDGCRGGWISYMDQCYLFVQEKMTWRDAERTCQSRAAGGHLTSISSPEHNDFLVSLAAYQGQKTAQFWTGGSHQKGSSLEWTDGSGVNFIQHPLTSLLHVIGETINSILNIRICLTLNINLGGQGKWDGSDCRKKLPFICSYKPNLTLP